MKRCISFFTFLTILSVFMVSATNTQPVIQTGHVGAVETFSYREDSSLLFSGGMDGTVRGWNPLTNELLVRLQISHLPVKMTALHPVLPRIACLETDGIDTFIISVWDYREKRKISVHRIGEMPLFLSYSPEGTYLVYGKTAWDSLVFLDGESGQRKSVLDEGFGIVSSVFFSSSEKTLLTYGPSGSIQYWDLETKRRKTRFSTEEGLAGTAFSSNGRFMLGKKQEKIFLIDLLSGKVLSSISLAENTSFAFDQSNDSIYILAERDDLSDCYIYDIQNGIFEKRKETSISFTASQPVIAAGQNQLFIGTRTGEIYTLDANSSLLTRTGGNNLIDISDIAIGSGFLVLSEEGNTLVTPLSSLTESGGNNSSLNSRVYENPFSGRAGISNGNNGTFYLWQNEKEGIIHTFDPSKGFTGSITASKAPIKDFSMSGSDTAVILDNNNTLSLIDLATGSELFSYSSFGIRSVVPLVDGPIMAGRNKTSALSAPLLLIHPDTGETVPLEGDTIVTLDLCYDPVKRVLYSLGIEDRGGALKTVLKTHRGYSWETSRTLFAFSGEDQSASFTLHPSDSTVFISIGYGLVRMYRWGGFSSLRRVARIPKTLKAADTYLFALNTDHTITVWNYLTGRVVTELYFFTDGSYAALGPEGKVTATPDASGYIRYPE